MMRHLFFISATICCLLLFTNCERAAHVYVCDNDNTFHLEERCEWLDGCHTGVTKITLNEARKRGMERCSNCSSYYEYMK